MTTIALVLGQRYVGFVRELMVNLAAPLFLRLAVYRNERDGYQRKTRDYRYSMRLWSLNLKLNQPRWSARKQ
jgi:hypothetical protein